MGGGWDFSQTVWTEQLGLTTSSSIPESEEISMGPAWFGKPPPDETNVYSVNFAARFDCKSQGIRESLERQSPKDFIGLPVVWRIPPGLIWWQHLAPQPVSANTPPAYKLTVKIRVNATPIVFIMCFLFPMAIFFMLKSTSLFFLFMHHIRYDYGIETYYIVAHMSIKKLTLAHLSMAMFSAAFRV